MTPPHATGRWTALAVFGLLAGACAPPDVLLAPAAGPTMPPPGPAMPLASYARPTGGEDASIPLAPSPPAPSQPDRERPDAHPQP